MSILHIVLVCYLTPYGYIIPPVCKFPKGWDSILKPSAFSTTPRLYKVLPPFWGKKKKSGSCALNQNLCLKSLEASQDKQGMLSVSRNKAAHSKAWGKEKPWNLSPMKAGSCVCFVHFFVLPVADNSCSMNTCCKKYYHAQKGDLETVNTIQRFLLITACI